MELTYIASTVEPPHKGHFGTSPLVMSFVRKLSSLRDSKCIGTTVLREEVLWDLKKTVHVLCRKVCYTACPYLGESTIGVSKVLG